MSFEPGSIVLTKIKGFPPWPSMVLPDELAPSNLINKKPKAIRAKTSGRRRSSVAPGEVGTVYLVKFFYDDNYIWANSTEIIPLTPEKIKELEIEFSKKRKANKSLQQALEYAKNTPDMNDFVQYGSKGVPEALPEAESIEESPKDEQSPEQEDDIIEEDEEEEDEDEEQEEEQDLDNESEDSHESSEEPQPRKRVKRKSAAVVGIPKKRRISEPITLSSGNYDKEVAEIGKLEAKYSKEFAPIFSKTIIVDDLGLSGRELNDYITKQTDALMKIRRKIASQVIKPADQFDAKVVRDSINELKKYSESNEIYTSLLSRVKLINYLSVLLKREDIMAISAWKESRPVAAALFKKLFGFEIDVQEGYAVGIKKEEVKQEPERQEQSVS